jgi:hypothetical protein
MIFIIRLAGIYRIAYDNELDPKNIAGQRHRNYFLPYEKFLSRLNFQASSSLATTDRVLKTAVRSCISWQIHVVGLWLVQGYKTKLKAVSVKLFGINYNKRLAYPAPPGLEGVGSILTNSNTQNVPSFGGWRFFFEMKLSSFYTQVS